MLTNVSRILITLAIGVLFLKPVEAVAQSMAMTNNDIIIRASNGETEGLWFDGDDLTLGGGNFDGDLIMKDSGGDTVITLDATSGDASLGGGAGQDGDLFIKNATGTTTGSVDGATGNFTNAFGGNGLVKAWARINADGSIASCYKCNTDTGETKLLTTGRYEVDFTIANATDISSRPWVCSVGHGSDTGNPAAQIGCVQRAFDPSSIYVEMEDETGADESNSFTIIIF